MLHDGTLVVTASRICNVRPKREADAAAAADAAVRAQAGTVTECRDPLARTI